MPLYAAKTQCRLCSSTSLELVLDLGHSPVGEEYILPEQQNVEQPLYPLALVRCTQCGQIQLGGVIDKGILYGNLLYETSRSLGLDLHFADYADTVMTLPDVHPGQWVVDMGSNTGALLGALQQHKMRVQGVEPAERIASIATKSGIPTQCCYFDEAFAQCFYAEHGYASVICANNVFANIDDLDTVMLAVKKLLSADGYFIMETGYALDLVQSFIIDNVYHEHLSYFLLTPLVRYFAQHDLRIVRAERLPTKGGALRVYARHMERNEEPSWSVEGLQRLECELMLTQPVPYALFNQKAQQRKEKAQGIVDVRTKCGPVAAFGAAVGCTTMLYWLGITEAISYIVDDNVLMHGRLSPHSHIPVLPPAVLQIRKPPSVLNLPWRYLHPIMERHKKYTEQGGHFVQLLPDAVVL